MSSADATEYYGRVWIRNILTLHAPVHRHAHNVVSALSLLIHLRLSRAKAAEIGARLPDSNPSQRENRW
ncbi:hypothetical protein PHYSODRAFT_343324 [Phytophthora sojae]|uniref:Uncharacterized protein n=1 Tax=Phytophthora sojae (strain P6497) TaxID=1094619 RepID=G5AJC4_PHYSP|nr:hypothetical protein PHYSODRAFT_331443 [Phytophthora sojae]XP_009540175.1 hypothetical protein PHYSODRAFT_343323 [Phytophthora sojae]XP_009540176.1 hypothetical protein PHYSODRAFT_343324 [Phytophthora sojae]EGZ04381.1 hypothetical protein PHYSODRAFT_343323 [Phytophthora sojae]EGZ04382.1 hypothetical protein PHYSODRAFT_343324 [Phytophthora sojae]EGZ17475.1 hypothetical protein PHYSODRAFT_331443 [Phytophthora sojae]|eukprot:XP_009526533.1 hypothetical protein PHYSODRAFT_331443 [Phytophthora sojae]